ncbi:YbjN domain-containing protein [Vogesella facilis]|uniref:YbjN domain-containing protein n=1 Tax=Vogesella facilis TaxID=1655232 RepID=A0ABV7RDB7_9NEIS
MMKYVLTTLACLAVLAPLAQAEDKLLDAGNPKALYELARGFGSAELGTSEKGNPKIKGRMDGMGYSIFFLQCEDGKKCRDVQFSAGWEGYDITQAQINDWNRRKNYSKAYLDEVNDPILEMDVVMNPGISPAAFERAFKLWKMALKDFRQQVLKTDD